MNEIGIALVWCALQVTGLTLFAAGLYAVFNRWAPSAAGTIPLVTLLMVVGLSVFAASPWPSWTGRLLHTFVGSDTSTLNFKTPRPPVAPSNRDGNVARSPRERNGNSRSELPTFSDDDAPGGLTPFWQALLQELQRSDADEGTPASAKRASRRAGFATTNNVRRWPGIVAAVFLVGMGLGLIRLLVGLWAVRSYRRHSEPIRDPSLQQLADVLRAELGSRKAVALRTSGRLVTAATVGWRKPIILLPAEWTTWNDQQRRAVLAHELAHVHRNDFLSWVAAQLGVVLHFYHPLVHWLSGRLRLEQELAADAEAARLSGGQQPYLQTLADLALRQDDRPLPLPARTFLPTRHTFLRRIEMLRDANVLKGNLSRVQRGALVGVLLAVGISVAGLRGGAATTPDSKDDKPARNESPSDQEAIQGTWAVVSVSENGPLIPKVTNIKFVFSGKRFAMWEREEVKEQGTFVLNVEESPKQITMHRGKPKPDNVGIYEFVDRNKLRMALQRREQRPEDFSPREDRLILVLKRSANHPEPSGNEKPGPTPKDQPQRLRSALPSEGPQQRKTEVKVPLQFVPKGRETSTDRQSLSLAWVPRDAVFVLAARPARILQRPAFKNLAQALEPDRPLGEPLTAILGMKPSQIEQVTFVSLPKVNNGRVEPAPGGFIIRATAASEPSELLKGFLPSPFEDHAYGPYRYHSGSTVPKQSPRLHKYAFVAPDKRTVIVTHDESAMRRMLAAGAAGAGQAEGTNLWARNEIAKADVAGVIDVARLRPGLQAATGPQFIGRESPLQSLRPLWEQSEQAAVGVSIDESVRATVLAECINEVGAQSVKQNLEASVPLLQNLLSGLRDDVSRRPNGEGLMTLRAIDVGDALLERFSFRVQGTTVMGEASIKADDAARLLVALIPAANAARQSAQRVQCMNNLRLLALAFHNYHDTHGHFPPAVITHKDGKKLKYPYSWRVAVLPYLDAANIYEQYHFDEPWDSEHNKQILKRMPAVFRHPGAPADSTNAAYFALVGPGTVFDGEEGTGIRAITDGTSYTILLAEAKRDIPWTKPEDIPYDPKKELPQLGGFHKDGFNAVLCDGAARFIPDSLDEKILRLLITRNDGQPIPQDQFP